MASARSVSGIYGVTGRATILDLAPALHAKQCICGVVVVALRAQHRCLSRQFVEQRLGVLQVGGVEAFSEPAVDLGEHRARFVATAAPREQSRQTHRCAQFPSLRTHLLRECDGFAEVSSCQFELTSLEPQFAARVESLGPKLVRLEDLLDRCERVCDLPVECLCICKSSESATYARSIL